MAVDDDHVYCTLVMSDAYLPGAAVLAHSLRDAGSTRKLACLIVQDCLRDSTIQELRTLYNHVIPIERIGNPNPANLYLMNRPDLLYTFTKIHLWRQTQFRKIVYLDADIVALRAPEELFDLPDSFAAAPDVGWPDAFNTGVMVLSPDVGEYNALRGLAGAGDSFDGGDQGLLNQYFEHRPWRRISFTYNTTPSANYQYEPAYRYYKRDIALVHFIGGQKPWQRERLVAGAPGAFQEMLSRWWAVYDRHFHVSAHDYIYGQKHPVSPSMHRQNSEHQRVNESHSPSVYSSEATGSAPPPSSSLTHDMQHQKPIHDMRNQPPPRQATESANKHRQHFEAPQMEWDATRGAPPVESKPEAINFPTQIYEFNHDPKPFRPPPSYPEPPKDMWYKVPELPRAEERPKPIFPWEIRGISKPARRFIEDEQPLSPPSLVSDRQPYADELEVEIDERIEPVTPAIRINDGDPWNAFASNRNAWDDVSGIENYVRALTKFSRNRGNIQVVQQNTPNTGQMPQSVMSPPGEADPVDIIQQAHSRRESLVLTDFPTADDRPSLPVTPAPRRRQTFWGDERNDEGQLPPAEGVPDQAEWDPSAQLEELRRSSLTGPTDLKLPNKKHPRRDMPPTAISIPEEMLAQHHATIANRDKATAPPSASVPESQRSTDELHNRATDEISSQGDQSAAAYGEQWVSSSGQQPAQVPTLSSDSARKQSSLIEKAQARAAASEQEILSRRQGATSYVLGGTPEITAMNTAINSSSSDFTFADLASFTASDAAPSISDRDIAADEIEMNKSGGRAEGLFSSDREATAVTGDQNLLRSQGEALGIDMHSSGRGIETFSPSASSKITFSGQQPDDDDRDVFLRKHNEAHSSNFRESASETAPQISESSFFSSSEGAPEISESSFFASSGHEDGSSSVTTTQSSSFFTSSTAGGQEWEESELYSSQGTDGKDF